MMEQILKRKDQTSIFCPQLQHHKQNFGIKLKLVKVVMASALIIGGLWLMVVLY
jgi:hypothetical protein